jgi:hypothetical protein
LGMENWKRIMAARRLFVRKLAFALGARRNEGLNHDGSEVSGAQVARVFKCRREARCRETRCIERVLYDPS